MSDHMKRHSLSNIQWQPLIICVLGTMIIGSISGIANAGTIDTWYANLIKPSFNPPNWIFGPVWTLLYLLMGVGLYLIYTSPSSAARTQALRLFMLQLLLNFAWSFLFFYFKSPLLAFIEIILLWITIILMIRAFLQVYPGAGWLQLPYLAWVSFASVLNFSIWYLNS